MTIRHPLPLIAIPADVREVGIHPFHIVGEKYILGVTKGAEALPVLLPSLGDELDRKDLIERIDGILFTGSPSNVEPHHYEGPSSRPGTMHDPQRDSTTLPLIREAIEAGVPILCICRGIQELNVALGGTLHQHVEEVPGLMNHRADLSKSREVQYAPTHKVTLEPGGVLAEFWPDTAVMVNSLHGQGIDRLAAGLAIEARAPDGLIEAVHVIDAPAFAIGVQWHPEWKVTENAFSMALFGAFGEAARARAARRQVSRPSPARRRLLQARRARS
ncbi:MAG: gamma-glutamyl-gamma-aminobutyrate hydrolase family protein [Alphaproteobacteria bacterium]|nr:gamma-glutamyl-gamma-aminobutyrate hydrolase family protein [Alphaproteobacteria bacterium]